MNPLDGLSNLNGNNKGLVNLAPSDSCGVGFVASISDLASREILELGLTSLANVEHRSATSSDGIAGDGAGITTTLPTKLVSQWLAQIASADAATDTANKTTGLVGVGVVFLPANVELNSAAENLIREQVKGIGLRTIGFREVPVNRDCLGPKALANMPRIIQVFIKCQHSDVEQFERELFLVRRSIELTPKATGLDSVYVASMSSRTICYKGMVAASKLSDLFTDLQDPDYECSVCVYHQRFSTNTSPEWSLCQPFRRLAHNGELSTVRGNRNWMSTREKSFEHPFWREHRGHIQRLFNFNDSDSASLDNAVELLSLSDRSLLHAIAMLIPPAWEKDPRVPSPQKAFHEFHGCFCEPWDGPAALAITDGKTVAACLDRNGLRPARYKITKDDILLVGSEAGADRIEDSRVIAKGRLAPGEMIAIDLQEGTLLRNDEIKTQLAQLAPYQDWLDEHSYEFHPRRDVKTDEFENVSTPEFTRQQIAAGLNAREIETSIQAMATDAKEPNSNRAMMDNPTPIAAFEHARPLTDYFKQRLAQVMHPAIDPIRELQGMSLTAGLGPERNILSESPYHCRVLNLSSPILLPDDLDQLTIQSPFKIQKIDCTWDRSSGTAGLQDGIRSVVQSAQLAIEQDATILVLSDRAVSEQRIAIPMLLALGAIHHGLCQTSHRMMCSIVVETSDVRDSHQLSLMFGYGATAVYPYLAYGTIAQLHAEETLTGPVNDSFRRYQTALSRGLLKILSETGVSILNSYQGAQIFEAIGLSDEVISTCFRHSYANLAGVGFAELAADSIAHHDAAFLTEDVDSNRNGNSNRNSNRNGDLRDLFQVVTKNSDPSNLVKVESVTDILNRFTTAAILDHAADLDSDDVVDDRSNGIAKYGRAVESNGTSQSDRGMTLVCPLKRHDSYSIEDLAQLIHELKVVDPASEVCVELVSQTGVGGIAVGLAKAKTHSILIGGSSRGGLCNLTNEDNTNVGTPWEFGIAEIHQSLIASSLRNRVILKVAGKIRSAHDVICAAILGAEEFILDIEGDLEQQTERLHVIANDCRETLLRMGACSIDQIIGRTELLAKTDANDNPRAGMLDFTALLHKPDVPFEHRSTSSKISDQANKVTTFDDQIVQPYLESETREFDFDVCNTDYNIGTGIAAVVAKQNPQRTSDNEAAVELRLQGSAGQSLGAYLCDGVRIDLTGEANDSVGKRMSGGEIAIRPFAQPADSQENLLAGNAVLYGATAGRLFVAGQVAERFCIRNSGASAVVESCGDHGCERMTGGTVVILGSIGNNFAAGMTGGTAFVWDPDQQLDLLMNRQTVTTSALTADDASTVQQLVTAFQERTGSQLAERLLSNWQHTLMSFRKISAKHSASASKPQPHFDKRQKDHTILSS